MSIASKPDISAATETPSQAHQHGHEDRGHLIGMILCCLPMVLAVVWLIFVAR